MNTLEHIKTLGARLAERDRELAAAEGRARAVELSFQFLADALPSIVWTATPTGEITYLNRYWYDYTGQDAATETTPLERRSATHPDERAHSLARWQEALLEGTPYIIEYQLRRHDGEYRWFLARALPMSNGYGDIILWVGTATDIHDQHLATAMALEFAEEISKKQSAEGGVSHGGI